MTQEQNELLLRAGFDQQEIDKIFEEKPKKEEVDMTKEEFDKLCKDW